MSSTISFVGNDINSVVTSALLYIKNYGVDRDSRNGPVKYISRAEMLIENPKERYLNIPGRKSNIFQLIAESLWVMSGSDEISPFLEFFLPRAKNFSDDGVTWRGAYGPRLYEGGQLQGILEAFQQDGLDTRRAVLGIYDPSKDSPEALVEKYGIEKTKDLPCNCFLNFWFDENQRLHLDTFQRSGDIFWGAGSINLFEFTFLQECMLSLMNRTNMNDPFTMGSYSHKTTNLHFYPELVGGQLNSMSLTDRFPEFMPGTTEELKTKGEVQFGTSIKDTIQMRAFFEELVRALTKAIEGDSRGCDIHEVFESNNVPTSEDNTLWIYARLTLSYITAKRFPEISVEMNVPGELNDNFIHLMKCVDASPFRKFQLVYED